MIEEDPVETLFLEPAFTGRLFEQHTI
jgi:hypothetical protein